MKTSRKASRKPKATPRVSNSQIPTFGIFDEQRKGWQYAGFEDQQQWASARIRQGLATGFNPWDSAATWYNPEGVAFILHGAFVLEQGNPFRVIILFDLSVPPG
ncbi:MAG: hypothetical protein ACLFUS_00940 [Candidatus Sumerlaeia bacterium]